MRRCTVLTFVLAAVAAAAAPGRALQAAAVQDDALEARVWLDRGDEPLLRRGDQVRIYYRTTEDAYGAIFRIDTDGRVSLIFPQDPGADARVLGGRDYRLLLPQSPLWRVTDDPGVGYIFMVASPYPLDFSAFSYDPQTGWDLSSVGGLVYEDPYVAIDDYVAELVPGWQDVPYALDFVTYNVGNTYSYPRFLCYDCHGFQPYSAWNPYSVPCTSIRVVIWDDPYFYPAYRYWGTHVVVARPARALPRYGVKARAPRDSWKPLVLRRQAPERRVVQYKEEEAAAVTPVTPQRPRRTVSSPTRGSTSLRSLPARQPPSSAPTRQEAPRAGASRPQARATPEGQRPEPDATGRPRLQRRPARPSARLPARAVPPARGAAPRQPARSVSPPGRAAGPRTRSVPPQPQPRRASPPARSVPARPSTQPRASQRPPAGSRSTRPSTPSRPSARPSTPSRPSARPSTGSRPTTRPSGPRPTVRARPSAPRR